MSEQNSKKTEKGQEKETQVAGNKRLDSFQTYLHTMRWQKLPFRSLPSKRLQVNLLGCPAFPACALDDTCRGCLDVAGSVFRSLRPGCRLIRSYSEKRVVGWRTTFLREPSRSAKLGLGLKLCLRLGLGQGIRLQGGLQRI